MQNLYLGLLKSIGPLRVEQLIISRLQYKLSNQMRHLPEFRRLRRIFGLVDALIDQCTIIINDKEAQRQQALQITEELLSLINVIGQKVVQQICKHFLVQFQLITFAMLARIHFCVLNVRKYLNHIDGIQVSKDNKTILLEDSPQIDKEFSIIDKLFEDLKPRQLNEAQQPVKEYETIFIEDSPYTEPKLSSIEQLFEDLRPRQGNAVQQLFFDLLPPKIEDFALQEFQVENLFKDIIPPSLNNLLLQPNLILPEENILEEGEVSAQYIIILCSEEHAEHLSELSIEMDSIQNESQQSEEYLYPIYHEQVFPNPNLKRLIPETYLIRADSLVIPDVQCLLETKQPLKNKYKSIKKYKYLFRKQLRKKKLYYLNAIALQEYKISGQN